MVRWIVSVALVGAVAGLAVWGALYSREKIPVVNPPYVPPTLGPQGKYELTYKPAGVIEDRAMFRHRLAGIAIDPRPNRLYAVGDREVKVFDHCATLKKTFAVGKEPYSVGVGPDGTLYVGQDGQVEKFTPDGERLAVIRADGLGRVSAVQAAGEELLVGHATAGPTPVGQSEVGMIWRFDKAGRRVGEIRSTGPPAATQPAGRRRIDTFILRKKRHLDFALTPDGNIVACNPGRKLVEFYRPDGTWLGQWGKGSNVEVAGFSYCCNPVNVAVLPRGGGDFAVVTAEKGTARVKIFDRGGKLLGVIWKDGDGKDYFDADNIQMDLAVDAFGRIYVADTEARVIRLFVKAQ